MSTPAIVSFELWMAVSDDGWLEGTMIATAEDGQEEVIATGAWPAPVYPSLVAKWVAKNVDISRTGVVVIQ